MKTNTKCGYCSKPIYKRPSHIKRYKESYCNRDCRFAKIRSLQSTVKCAACKKEIKLDGKRKRNSKTGLYFCSNECKNPYIAKNRRWADNPLSHRGRRNEALKKANNKCQNCGYDEDTRMLDIHHRNGNHRDNSWKNLTCLCAWCHTLHHRKVKEIKNMPMLFDD